MKIRVTWEKPDVEINRKVRDISGSKCLIIQSDHPTMGWSILRLADGWYCQPLTLDGVLNKLNDGGYTPEEIH